MNPWWSFTLWDVAFAVCCLTIVYAIFGPPDLIGWLLVAPGIMLGRWLGHKLRKEGRIR